MTKPKVTALLASVLLFLAAAFPAYASDQTGQAYVVLVGISPGRPRKNTSGRTSRSRQELLNEGHSAAGWPLIGSRVRLGECQRGEAPLSMAKLRSPLVAN